MHTKHHAVLFEGEKSLVIEAAKQYVLETLNVSIEQNPDVVHLEYERLTIDHARGLKEQAAQAPLGQARVFIITCDSILIEAQNALLKLFEEPAQQTYFILTLPSSSSLLPTVQSRLLYAGRYTGIRETTTRAHTFLESTMQDRMKMIDNIIDDKNRMDAQAFIHELEYAIHEQNVLNNKEALTDISLASEYIKDRSSSVKHILSHLAVTL